jgi:hypothetical protein
MGQVKKDGLKLICTHQILVFAADVNIFERKLLTVKENTAASLVSVKENGMELNSVKTTYVVMIRTQEEVTI